MCSSYRLAAGIGTGNRGSYLMILYFNGSPHGYTPNEIAGIAVCLVLIAVCSLNAILYLSEDIEICLENIENLSSATSKKGGNILPL